MTRPTPRDRRHLRVVPTPVGRHQATAVPGPRPAPGARERDRALAARTRASLDGFGVVEITHLAALLRHRLTHHLDVEDRAAVNGPAAGRADQPTPPGPAGPVELAPEWVALGAYDEVLSWMLENGACVYHGELD